MKNIIYAVALLTLISACKITSNPASNQIDLTNISQREAQNWSKGEACATTVLGHSIKEDTESLIQKAIINGGINKLKTISHSRTGLPILFEIHCVVAYGER